MEACLDEIRICAWRACRAWPCVCRHECVLRDPRDDELHELREQAGLAAAVWQASGRSRGFASTYTGFAPSLLPIAVAYHLAHHVSYLALAGQLLLPIASDPFGLGWDLFGHANRPLDIGVITAEDVWWVAVAALVAGHGCSVFVAHAEALRLYGSVRRAVRSQIPMMVFVVGLTALSLWILSHPIVE